MDDECDDPEVMSVREQSMAAWQGAADLVAKDLVETTELRWPLVVESMTWDFDDDDLDRAELMFSHGSGNTLLPDYPVDPSLAATVAAFLPSGITIKGFAAAHLADMVQEEVIEHFERAWPECPEHRRPMDPSGFGPTGHWVCSKDPAEAAPIGGLALWLAERLRE